MSMIGAESEATGEAKGGASAGTEAARVLAAWISSAASAGRSGAEAERARAVGELLAEHEELRRKLGVASRMLALSPVVSFVWRVEPGYPVEYVSDNVETAFGHTVESLMSGRLRFLDLVHEGDVERVRRACDASAREGRVLEHSYRMRRSDGSVLLVQETSRPMRLEGGGGDGEIRVIGFVRDMTAQQALLDQVQESRARLRALFDQASAGMVEVGRDGLVTDANKAMTRFLGWERSEVVGFPWQKISHPDDTARCEREVGRVIACEQDFFQVEKRYAHKDGGYRWGRVSISAIRDERGNLDRLLAVIVDIEESRRARERLHESEAQLRAIFNSAPIGISMATPEGVLRIANKQLQKILGRSEDEIRGLHWSKFTFPEDKAENDRAIAEALRMGTDAWTLEKRYVRPDGSVVWANLNTTLLRDEAGVPMGTVATVEDITHRRRLEQELAESKRMESLGRLAGGVAHDFNNLLTAIMGYASILQKRVQDADVREVAGRITAASTSAAGLTRQLLAFARRQDVTAETVDLGEAVRQACEIARGLIGAGQRLVVTAGPEGLPVRADRSQLEQVVLNLVANAADASSEDGRIEVRVERGHWGSNRGEASPRMAVLDVRDFGEGIDASVLPHIFEPFFTTKPRGRGTGLGLATVYGIVKQAGGTVMVESDPGRGSLFRVLWPLASGEGAGGSAEGAERALRSDSGSLRGSVLVVEDEPLVRELVEGVLRSAGCEVDGVGSGEEALAKMERRGRPYEVVLTDAVMPGMGGVELIRLLKGRGYPAPTIMMTGYSEASDRLKAVTYGAEVIGKPFAVEDLVSAVRKALSDALGG